MAMAASFVLPRLPLSHAHTTLSISCSASNGNPSAAAAATIGSSSKSLTLHVGETSITMPMSIDKARELSGTMEGLIQTFAEKQKAHEDHQGRPKRLKSVEFGYSAGGDGDGGSGVGFELFCNPNAYSNAFQAKVLVSVSDGKLSMSAEADLSTIKADVDGFIESLG